MKLAREIAALTLELPLLGVAFIALGLLVAGFKVAERVRT
jgi:hypothetical protein